MLIRKGHGNVIVMLNESKFKINVLFDKVIKLMK